MFYLDASQLLMLHIVFKYIAYATGCVLALILAIKVLMWIYNLARRPVGSRARERQIRDEAQRKVEVERFAEAIKQGRAVGASPF